MIAQAARAKPKPTKIHPTVRAIGVGSHSVGSQMLMHHPRIRPEAKINGGGMLTPGESVCGDDIGEQNLRKQRTRFGAIQDRSGSAYGCASLAGGW